MARLKAQMANECGRHVHEDAFAADLELADVAADDPADAVEAAIASAIAVAAATVNFIPDDLPSER